MVVFWKALTVPVFSALTPQILPYLSAVLAPIPIHSANTSAENEETAWLQPVATRQKALRRRPGPFLRTSVWARSQHQQLVPMSQCRPYTFSIARKSTVRIGSVESAFSRCRTVRKIIIRLHSTWLFQRIKCSYSTAPHLLSLCLQLTVCCLIKLRCPRRPTDAGAARSESSQMPGTACRAIADVEGPFKHAIWCASRCRISLDARLCCW